MIEGMPSVQCPMCYSEQSFADLDTVDGSVVCLHCGHNIDVEGISDPSSIGRSNGGGGWRRGNAASADPDFSEEGRAPLLETTVHVPPPPPKRPRRLGSLTKLYDLYELAKDWVLALRPSLRFGPAVALTILLLWVVFKGYRDPPADEKSRAAPGQSRGLGRQGDPPGAREGNQGKAKASSPEVVFLTDRGRVTVSVSVADAVTKWRGGVADIAELHPDAGVLYVFARPKHRTFWTKDTKIPLDIIFIKARTVVGVIADAEPMSRKPLQVKGTSQYVLEVNAGFAAQNQIKKGTRLIFNGLKKAPEKHRRTQ